MENILVVKEYLDVIPEGVSNLSLDREVEFVIDVLSKTVFISKAPYRMAPTEMKELKV